MKANRWTEFLTGTLVVSLGILWQNLTPYQRSAAATSTQPPETSSILPQKIAEQQVPDEGSLVDIGTVNPNIRLDIRYATTNNFLKRQLYKEARCALRAGVAQKLSRVQEDLQKRGLGLKVYDCYRPLSVTAQMWEVLPDPRYVANPANGSRHNRGAAVDLTLVDSQGAELPMPTEFDDFTDKAARDYPGNDVSPEAQKNSQLLEEVMTKHGFDPLVTEWWHFDAADWQKFAILDIPYEAIPKP